jgi:Na+/H+ antiporter NhaC
MHQAVVGEEMLGLVRLLPLISTLLLLLLLVMLVVLGGVVVEMRLLWGLVLLMSWVVGVLAGAAILLVEGLEGLQGEVQQQQQGNAAARAAGGCWGILLMALLLLREGIAATGSVYQNRSSR